MSSNILPIFAPTQGVGHSNVDDNLPRAAEADPFYRLLQVGKSNWDTQPEPVGQPAGRQDWSASIQLIRDMATRIREMQKNSREVADDAREFARNAGAEIEAAQQRETQAVKVAEAAMDRLKRAEELVRLLKLRLQQSEERAETAEKLLAEFHTYLRRTYDSLGADLNGEQR